MEPAEVLRAEALVAAADSARGAAALAAAAVAAAGAGLVLLDDAQSSEWIDCAPASDCAPDASATDTTAAPSSSS